ncbi:MAG: hypothetical protein AAF004_05230 [Pseudomonadota bacterium]
MRCAIFVSLLLIASGVDADDWQGEVSIGTRYFVQSTPDPRQDQWDGVLSGTLGYFNDWDDNRQRFALALTARVDSDDPARNLVDIGEMYWRYRWQRAEIAVGIDRVFWGVTEALHLVDVINQSDLTANPDSEDKLGQPMVRLTLTPRWGTLDVLLMPRFRERRFPGSRGRLRGPIQVRTDATQFESADARNHLDIAARYSHYVGPFEFAVAHFAGTQRQPLFVPLPVNQTAPALAVAPVYFLTDQSSIELTYARGSWLWKLEALSGREPQGRGFAATGGFEYTWSRPFNTSFDVGVIAEYQYDERRAAIILGADDDLVAGMRIGFNDLSGSELLLLAGSDLSGDGRLFSLEASRRLGQHWRAALEARFFSASDANDTLALLAREDYWQLSVTRFF